MKRHFSLSLICAGGLLLAPLLPAQDATAAAERDRAEERYRSMNARLDDLEAAALSYQNRMNEMKQQINRLQDEIDRLKSKNDNASSGVQESLKHLQEAVLAVDKKRQNDNEKTARAVEEMEERMKKLILEKPAPRTPVTTPPRNNENTAKPEPPSNPGARESGYEYAIRDNDTLSGIVVLLRGQGLKVTQKMLMEANPNVNWNKLRVNQKIFIPAPPT